MPRGLRDYKETTLVDNSDFISPNKSKALIEWWLEKSRGANLPNWDIASTCTIEGIKGLLLVEAKAHDKELSEAGKSQPATSNGQMNHKHIGIAIEQANAGLNGVMKGWALSRDSHYQVGNRFAWAWKLATLGVPIILEGYGESVRYRCSGHGADYAHSIAKFLLSPENSVQDNAYRAAFVISWVSEDVDMLVGGDTQVAMIHDDTAGVNYLASELTRSADEKAKQLKSGLADAFGMSHPG